MSSSSNKARLASLKRQLERLEARRAAEVARTRADLGEGMTIDACIAQFEAEQTAKAEPAVPVTDASFVGAKAMAQADGPWVEHAYNGEQPGYCIVDNDIKGSLIPTEQDVEHIILESYRQGTAKEGR